METPGRKRVNSWLRERGWKPFDFQQRTWDAYARAESGLVHAPTGVGKTLAVWLGPLIEWLDENPAPADAHAPPLRVLWITPMRALANDTADSLREAASGLGLPWTIELRTGDTSAAIRKRQRTRLPSALVTTPESLSLILSYPDSAERLATLRCIVMDEWHELLGTKRGVQAELCLSRLRALATRARTWGLSATLGNIDEAMDTLLGCSPDRPAGTLIHATSSKRVDIKTLTPPDIERFPWAGHLGIRLLPDVLRAIDAARSTLLFTNTRSFAEIWFQSILRERPEWLGEIAIHHGSLDRALRERVEDMLRAGRLRCVVCTSSLDLGVDFTPVDQVIQIGSPKGVARLLQRAGRSGHQPGATSRILCAPTNALELVEFAAVRAAAQKRHIESREPLERPLDVLVQHLVTLALGSGFIAREALAEVRSSRAYRALTDDEWRWCIDFITRGGPALRAYPDYARAVEKDGRFTVESPRIARLHRMSVGTIVSDGSLLVRYLSGASLGSIEEGFLSRFRPGDRFVFAGRRLELVMVRDMTAYVRRAPSAPSGGPVPRWMGGRMPLSSELAAAVRAKLDGARRAVYDDPEMRAARPVLELQARWSRIPAPDELLIEQVALRDGHCAFFYPFEGRLVHEGLGALVAHRIAAKSPVSISVMASDHGVGLLSPAPIQTDEPGWRDLLSTHNLLEDLLACLNSAQLARRRFRGIARVAGLIFPGFPGAAKTARQLQASSEMFYDVFTEFDPANLLLDQAKREVLERELEVARLRATLERARAMSLTIVEPGRLTPFSFSLWADWAAAQVSSERWIDRVRRMAVLLEEEADGRAPEITIKESRRRAPRRVAG